VHPADLRYTYTVFTILGGIAGFVAGLIFAITALFCAQCASEKSVPAKPVDVADEV
jgi:hypothetical protein